MHVPPTYNLPTYALTHFGHLYFLFLGNMHYIIYIYYNIYKFNIRYNLSLLNLLLCISKT